MISPQMANFSGYHDTSQSSNNSSSSRGRTNNKRQRSPSNHTHEPPPRREKDHQQQQKPRGFPQPPLPPLPKQSSPSNSHRSALTKTALANSEDETESEEVEDDDDDETDDENPIVQSQASGDVEDVCLACEGECHCGAAKGAKLYVAPRGLKIKITLNSNPSTSTSASASPLSAPLPPIASTSTAKPSKISFPQPPRPLHSSKPPKPTPSAATSSNPSRLRRSISTSSSSDEYAPRKSSPKKRKISVNDSITTTSSVHRRQLEREGRIRNASVDDAGSGSATSSIKRKGRPRKVRIEEEKVSLHSHVHHHHGSASVSTSTGTPLSAQHSHPLKRKGSNGGGGTASRPLPTPSRSSLRQVLAASAKDVEPRSTTTSNYRMESHVPGTKEHLSEVSDLDLDTSDSSSSSGEEDAKILRSEEKALRDEWEHGSEEESSEEGNSDLCEDDANDREKQRWNMETEGEEDEHHDGREKDLLDSGGRGVVTWSDYDSVDDDDAETIVLRRTRLVKDGSGPDSSDDSGRDIAGEFEDELEELLALSEAVVGPVRDDEYEMGEMWFEEILNGGDDESGEGDESSDDDSDSDEDGRTLVVVDGWTDSGFRRQSGSHPPSGSSSTGETGDESEYGYMYFDSEDGGETTDSLDSDDHVGLVRFGIEVDSDSSDSSFSDAALFRPAPGTASLADVQAPTSADLAFLPQYLFSGSTTSLSVKDDASLGGSGATSVSMEVVISDPLPFSSCKAKGKAKARIQDIKEEEEETETEGEGSCTATGERQRTSPAMGIFVPKKPLGKKKKEISVVVIDGSDVPAPSPFSKVKKAGHPRARELLFDGTPSRCLRADSKVSAASSMSVTDGSISGELADSASPYVSPNANLKLELDDVLDASYLHSGSSSRSHSSPDGSEAEVISELQVATSTSTKKPPSKAKGLSDLSRWDRIPIGAFRSSSSTTTGQYFVTSPPEQRGPINASTSRIFLPFGATASSALRGSRSSLSHTLSNSNITSSTTKRAIEKRMLASPIFGPSFVEAAAPKSRKVKRKEKKSQSSTTLAVTSPKHSIFPSGNKGKAPMSSPFLAPPPSSNDGFAEFLHSPLFGATIPSSSSIHRT